jgi:hypothetical protein
MAIAVFGRKDCIGWRPAKLSARRLFPSIWFKPGSIDQRLVHCWDRDERPREAEECPDEQAVEYALETIAQAKRQEGYEDL